MEALGIDLRKGGNLEIIDVKEPPLKDDMIKIEIDTCLLCGSEASHQKKGGMEKVYKNEYFKDFYPPDINIYGHEFTGIVADTGKDVKDFKRGDRVVVITAKTFACGSCEYCVRGEFCLCRSRWNLKGKIIYGGFTKNYYCLPKVLLKLPGNISLRDGAFMEPLACCVKGLYELADIKEKDYVLVSGPGILGILTSSLAKNFGAQIIVLGINGDENRLEAAKRLGADFVINTDQADYMEEIKDITGGKGINTAFECGGAANSVINCLRSLKFRGTMVQMGMMPDEIKFDYNIIFMKNLIVKGSFGSNENSWNISLKLLGEKRIDLSAIDVEVFKLKDWRKAFNMHNSKKSVVVQIKS